MNVEHKNFILELKNSNGIISNHGGRKNLISIYKNKLGIIYEEINTEIKYSYNKNAFENYMKYVINNSDLYKLINTILENSSNIVSNYFIVKENLFKEKGLIELSNEFKILYLYKYNVGAFNSLLDNIYLRLVCKEYAQGYRFKKLLIDNIFTLGINVNNTISNIHKGLECLNKNDKIGYLFYEMNQNNFSEYSLKDMIEILIKNKDVNFNIKITEDFYFNNEMNCMIIKNDIVKFTGSKAKQILGLLLHAEGYKLTIDNLARKIATENNNDLNKIKTLLEDTTFQNIKKFLRKKGLSKDSIKKILIKNGTYYKLKKMN